MTWRDPHPDTTAEFSNRFYDELDAEDAAANALADRLTDTSPSFAAISSHAGGEAARPLRYPAGLSGPDAPPPPPDARRDQSSSLTGPRRKEQSP